jgi:pyruvate formate lyase activating enzyme
MEISRFLKQTLIDYPNKFACEIFTPECNYKCPSCHSKYTINGGANHSEEEIFDYLDKSKGLVEGVVICGGEPTLQKGLPDFCRKLKKMGLSVKLDTNGGRVDVLDELLKSNLVDYVAMDIKGPKNNYGQITNNFDYYTPVNVSRNMRLLAESGCNYEFRTTIAPIFKNGNGPSWISPEEYVDMAKWIVDSTGKNNHKHYVQKFISREKDEMNDERFAKENLAKEFQETPSELLVKIQEAISSYLPNCKIR